jgi:hypothetical protein
MNRQGVDLMRDVLDHEIVDCDGVPCGMVDDLELSGGPGSALSVEALLVGPGAWSRRLPWFFPRLVQAMVGRKVVRIAWADIAVTGDRVKLTSTATDLDLNLGDRRIERWFTRAR